MKRASILYLLPFLSLGGGHDLHRRPADDLEHAFERVAEAIRPGVVTISSTRRIRLRQFDDLDELRDFFGFGRPRSWPLPDEPGKDDENTLRERGMGSGVIVSTDGHVLTNHHVVAESSDLKVYLADRREFPARIVGVDPRSDLAVLKIEASGLVPLAFGDSDALAVGQWVAAFGSPFGLDQTMSCGIVSAKGRTDLRIADFEDFLQTDAAINPGNSGGPLVDLAGKVVGINTAIVTRSGGYQGVGLAIPATMARSIMDRLVNDGQVVRGWLGVTIQELTPDLARSFGLRGKGGVLVADVVQGSPAERAGLAPGDVILLVGGQAVEGTARFRNRIAEGQPGTKLPLALWHEGRELTLEVVLGTAPDSSAPAQPGVDARGGFGLELGDLTPKLRHELGLSTDEEGVAITRVLPDSSAEEAGLQPGDVIVEIDRATVSKAAQAQELLRKAEADGVLLRVARRGSTHWVHLSRREPGH